MPTEGAPAATAANAYSICTNFPDGLKAEITTLNSVVVSETYLKVVREKLYRSEAICWTMSSDAESLIHDCGDRLRRSESRLTTSRV